MQFVSPNQIHVTQKGKFVRFPRTVYLTDWNTNERKTVIIEAGSVGVIFTLLDANREWLIALNKDTKRPPSKGLVTTFGHILVKIGIGQIDKVQIEA